MSHDDTAQKKATAAKKKAEQRAKGRDGWESMRDLPVGLLPAELLAVESGVFTMLDELDILRGDAAESAADYRARIKVMEGELSELRKSKATGTQRRSVACREVPDYKKGTVTIFRKNSGELVEERTMLPDERQQEIAGDVEAAREKAAAKKKPAKKKPGK